MSLLTYQQRNHYHEHKTVSHTAYFNIPNTNTEFFYVLLTVHLSIFILVINQLDAPNFVLQ